VPREAADEDDLDQVLFIKKPPARVARIEGIGWDESGVVASSGFGCRSC
jgi:hypothetical protein